MKHEVFKTALISSYLNALTHFLKHFTCIIRVTRLIQPSVTFLIRHFTVDREFIIEIHITIVSKWWNLFFFVCFFFTSTSFLLFLYISFAMSLILCWISLLIANFSNFLLDLFSLFFVLYLFRFPLLFSFLLDNVLVGKFSFFLKPLHYK